MLISILRYIWNTPKRVSRCLDEASKAMEDISYQMHNYQEDKAHTDEAYVTNQIKDYEQSKLNQTEVLSDQLMSAAQKTDHLQSKYWHDLKQAKLQKAGNYCEKCGKLSKHLDLHHKTYIHLGYEDLTDVILLCRQCHEAQHQHYGKDRLTDYSQII